MHDHTLELLEYPKILDRLAFHCAFSGGQAQAQALRPSPDRITVQTGLALTQEAYEYLAHQPEPSFGGITDVSAFLVRAQRRAMLLPGELRDIQLLLERTRVLQRTFTKHATDYPGLAEMAGLLHACRDLATEIARCINERAEVMHTASTALASIRSRLRVEQGRLTRTLERLTASTHLTPYLQDALVTQRQGRYVLPVRAEYRGKIPGIVHDQSTSGATLFVEPLEVVEHNNAVRMLELEEEKEVRRILTELTALVAAEAETLALNVSVLSDLDFTLAKGRLAYALHGIVPEIREHQRAASRPQRDAEALPVHQTHPGSRIWLRQARHPLLDPDEVVPLNFELGPELGPTGCPPSHVMIITGPNTGGKTVAMKTVGLLVLMAQSGLMIPAGSGSCLSVFADVHADIGDEQSIEQSLSTFSSHLTRIVAILEEATDASLVILDEIGAGTDPEEGSALAIALLEHLRHRGVTTLASTHYSDIKLYAHSTPSVSNAAMEFDVESLRPTFRLNMGLPGKSNALAIARRLGLPEAIVSHAESNVHDDVVNANSMLEDIRQARERIQAQVEQTRQERERTRLAKSALLYRLRQVEEDRRAVLAEARTEVERLVAAARVDLAQLRKQVSADIWDQERSKRLQTLAETQGHLDQLTTAVPAEMPDSPPGPATRAIGPIAQGDTVWVPQLGATGQVVSLSGGRAEVQAGAMRFKTRVEDLELRHKPAPDRTTRQVKVRMSRKPRTRVSMELDIRGTRVDPGVAQVDQYLQDAYLSSMPWVRVIHGKGTGQLRDAVRALMRRHPHVTHSRPGNAEEGGDGVTVALFDSD